MPPFSTITAPPLTLFDRSIEWLVVREETLRRVAILTLIYLIPAIWILQPAIIDPDIWWHLAAGKWMSEHGSLPATDPFSAYGAGKPWIAYSWLFELGMYGLMQSFGELGILLYVVTVIWLVIMVVHRFIGARCQDFLVVTALLTISMVALSKLYTPRPWLLTIVFFTLTLDVVLSLRAGRQSRYIWFLPLAYIAWANIHIQFIYGLGLLGLACIAPVLDRFVTSNEAEPKMPWNSSQWKRQVSLTMLCVLATLVTPHHVHLYRIVIELSMQTGMWEYTREMLAPSFRSAADWAMLGLFAAALIRLGSRRSRSSFEWLLLLVASASAFRGQRDIWFLVLASLVILVPNERNKRQNWFSVPGATIAPTILMVAIGCVCILWYRGFSTAEIQKNTGKVYPVEAAAFVERKGYQGALYNHFNWGGYLIWRLPHLKVSMDGRANVHGDERIKRMLATWGGEPEWREDPDLEQASLVIANRPFPLTSILKLDSRFETVYEDETSVVFVRKSAS